jgi:hypothetical protein
MMLREYEVEANNTGEVLTACDEVECLSDDMREIRD